MNLFDSHAHYNDAQFDEDREQIIQETLAKGVSRFVVAGYSLASSKKALEIAANYPEAYVIVGISPNDIEDIHTMAEVEEAIRKLEEIMVEGQCTRPGGSNMPLKVSKQTINPNIVAIGEIGLDYHWNTENKELQKAMFIAQINLANKYQLPIVIHTREAVMDTLQILKENEVQKRGIFHCCPLNRELVKEGLTLGYYISLSGVITFKNAKNANEIIAMVPAERLLIETDSPYLAPEPVRGTRNNCMNVKYVAEKIAQVKNKTVEEVAEITNQNAKRIFEIEG